MNSCQVSKLKSLKLGKDWVLNDLFYILAGVCCAFGRVIWMEIFTNSHNDNRKQWTLILQRAEVVHNRPIGTLDAGKPDVVCRCVGHEN